MSEALLFEEHVENMLCTKIVLNVRNNFFTQHVLPRFELGIFMYWTCNSMNNLSSYRGLVDAKIRASDKDLPVIGTYTYSNLILSFSKNHKWNEILSACWLKCKGQKPFPCLVISLKVWTNTFLFLQLFIGREIIHVDVFRKQLAW